MRRFPIPRTSTMKLNGTLLAFLHDKGLKGTLIIRYISIIFQRALVPCTKKCRFNFGTLTFYNLYDLSTGKVRCNSPFPTTSYASYISIFRCFKRFIIHSFRCTGHSITNCRCIVYKLVKTKSSIVKSLCPYQYQCDTVTRITQRFHSRVNRSARKYCLAFAKCEGYNVGLGINLSILG